MNYSQNLQFAIDTAKEAGAILLKGFKQQTRPQELHEHEKEIVSEWDTKAEKLILSRVKEHYPQDNILTEHTGFVDNAGDNTWIIDPIDGTGNFSRGNPLFTVSIAYQVGDTLEVAVVYTPVTGELFSATREQGAYLGDKKLTVSDTQKLTNAWLVSCEGALKDRTEYASLLYRMRSRVIDVRKLGSAALECAYVAAGRADGYIATQIEPWDVAAGVLLVQEAGGKITNAHGKPWTPATMTLVASNGPLHANLLELLSA